MDHNESPSEDSGPQSKDGKSTSTCTKSSQDKATSINSSDILIHNGSQCPLYERADAAQLVKLV